LDGIINLDVLAHDEKKFMEVLDAGDMVALRSGNDFLYVVKSQRDREYRLFSHTPGSPGGGTKSFPFGEQNDAVVRKLAAVADARFHVGLEAGMDIRHAMAAAEEGILTMFPTGDRDADGMVDFSMGQADERQENGNGE
jgi:hypothetical protein